MGQSGMMPAQKQDATENLPELHAALVRQLYSQSRTGLLGALAAAYILAFLLRDQVPHWELILWLSCYTALQIPRYCLIAAFSESAPDHEALDGLGRRFVLLSILSAIFWGITGWFFFPSESLAHQSLVLLVLVGVGSVAAFIYSPLLECFLPVVPATLLPLAARYLCEGTGFDQTIGGLVLMYTLVLLLTARRMHQVNVHSAMLSLEKDGLIGSLEEGKALAEKLNERLMKEAEDRTRAETALRQREEEFRVSFENAVDAIFWADRQTGLIVRCNKAAERLLEKERDQIVGSPQTALHPPHQAGFHAKEFRQPIEQSGTVDAESGVITQSGRIVPVRITASITTLGGREVIQGIFRDISERKKVEHELRLLSSAVEQSSEGVAVAALDGTILYLNKALARMHGYEREELIGKNRSIFHTSEQLETVQEANDRTQETGRFAGEIWHVRRDGEVFPTQMHNSLLQDDEGNPVGITATVRDITARKQSEALLIAQRDLSVSLSGARNLREALSTCVDTALRVSGLDCAAVYVCNEDGSMNLTAHRGFSREFQDHVGHLDSDSVQAQRARAGKPIYATHEEIAGELDAVREKEALRGLAIIPIVHEGKAVACFNLASRRSDSIPASTRTALETMALQIGSAIARIRTGEALRRSEVRFRRIFYKAPVMMHSIDRSGVIRDVNAKWLSEMGYTRQEVIGEELLSFLAPPSSEAFSRNVHKFWSVGRVSGLSFHLFRKDGTSINVLLDSIVSNDPVLGLVSISVMVDVTDRKRMENALRESEHRYRTLFEHSPIPLWIEDLSELKAYLHHLQQEGRADLEAFFGHSPSQLIKCASLVKVVDVNETTLRMYQARSKDQFLGGITDLVCEETLESITKEIIAVAEGRTTFEIETINRTFTGDKRNIFLRWAVTPGHEETYSRVLVSVMDITRRKRAEELLVQSERIQAVGEMAGGVAHNFNNLLQIVIGRIHMARSHLDSGNPDGVKANLNQVLDGARMGAHTVKRLQDFARVRTEEPEQEGTTFDLSGTVRDAVEMSSPLWKTFAHKEGLDIDLATHLERGCLIKGNENELFEVVVNLTKNAVEALPQGGRIRITTFSRNDWAILRVMDTGAGIAKENLSRVLEPFWTTKGDHGTGLGLASSYGIVRRHGGTVHVESEEGQGATFTVRIPRTSAPPRGRLSTRERSLDVRLNVLIVDDIEPVLTTLNDALTALGQTVFLAQSGPRAIEIFRKTEIHVVICDLGMPEMNGWEVAEAVKEICEEKSIPKTPFILLTGWGGQLNEGERMAKSGVDRVVEKPLDIARLAHILREVTQPEARSAN